MCQLRFCQPSCHYLAEIQPDFVFTKVTKGHRSKRSYTILNSMRQE